MIKNMGERNSFDLNFREKIDYFLKASKTLLIGAAICVSFIGCEYNMKTSFKAGQKLTSAQYAEMADKNINGIMIIKDDGRLFIEKSDSLKDMEGDLRQNYVLDNSNPALNNNPIFVHRNYQTTYSQVIDLGKEKLDKLKKETIAENSSYANEFVKAAIKNNEYIFIESDGRADFRSTGSSRYSSGEIVFENEKIQKLYEDNDELAFEAIEDEYSTEHHGSSNLLMWYYLYGAQMNNNSTMAKAVINNNLYNSNTIKYHTGGGSITTMIDRQEKSVFKRTEGSTTMDGWRGADSIETKTCSS